MTAYEQAKRTKLFQFGAEFEALNDLIAENHGELTATLETFQVEIEEAEAVKIDSCVAYLRSIEAQIHGANLLVKEINDNCESLEKKKNNFKNYLLYCLNKSGKKELKGNAFKLKPRSGVFSVKITNEDLVPAIYLEEETKFKINKKSIGEAWKAGSQVDGTSWVQGPETISISSGI